MEIHALWQGSNEVTFFGKRSRFPNRHGVWGLEDCEELLEILLLRFHRRSYLEITCQSMSWYHMILFLSFCMLLGSSQDILTLSFSQRLKGLLQKAQFESWVHWSLLFSGCNSLIVTLVPVWSTSMMCGQLCMDIYLHDVSNYLVCEFVMVWKLKMQNWLWTEHIASKIVLINKRLLASPILDFKSKQIPISFVYAVLSELLLLILENLRQTVILQLH